MLQQCLKIAQKGLFLTTFLGLVIMPLPAMSQELKSPKTAFSLVENWLEYPGLNADLTVGYEFLTYQDFARGFSTSFLVTGKIIEWRYGFSKGLSSDWSTHEFGPSISIKDLQKIADFDVPGLLQNAGVGLSYGPKFLNNGVETLKLNAVLIGVKF